MPTMSSLFHPTLIVLSLCCILCTSSLIKIRAYYYYYLASPFLKMLRNRAATSIPLAVAKRMMSSASPQPGKPPSTVARVWKAYSNSLNKRPLPTKCTAAALIFFSSDTAAQYLTRDKTVPFVWDAWRATSGAIFAVVATWYLHQWWGVLEVVCERIVSEGKSKVAHVAVKVLIDQGLGAPTYIYLYYTITNFSQTVTASSVKQAWTESTDKANEMLWETMLRHWRLWPVVHSFNFYYVPLQHRVLVQNLVLVGWSGYLSHLNNGGLLVTPKDEVEIARRLTLPRPETKGSEIIELHYRYNCMPSSWSASIVWQTSHVPGVYNQAHNPKIYLSL